MDVKLLTTCSVDDFLANAARPDTSECSLCGILFVGVRYPERGMEAVLCPLDREYLERVDDPERFVRSMGDDVVILEPIASIVAGLERCVAGFMAGGVGPSLFGHAIGRGAVARDFNRGLYRMRLESGTFAERGTGRLWDFVPVDAHGQIDVVDASKTDIVGDRGTSPR